jgi:alpha-tubulin suppressor-like RCC1 family protein
MAARCRECYASTLGYGRIGFDTGRSDGNLGIDGDLGTTPQLTVGWRHACVRDAAGDLTCWGDNDLGQLGTGDLTDVLSPVAIASSTTWKDVSAGETHTCALDPSGAAWCWGTSTNGQLGLGATLEALVPTPLADGRSYTRIFAGTRHTCAIAIDGTLWCWGRNGARQLGVGGNLDRSVPEQVLVVSPQTGPDDAWLAVGPGDDHTCALQDDGSAWCFGSEANGQLGQGASPAVRDRPEVLVMAPRTFTAVAAGRDYSCGLVDGGQIATWGRNDEGQLGLGDQSDRSIATLVRSAGAGFARIACGLAHACALHGDGSVRCWGRNSLGQAGNGTTGLPNTVPSLVSGAWAAIGAGNDFSCALDEVGATWCWGDGGDGRLGHGSTESSSVPVSIPAQ